MLLLAVELVAVVLSFVGAYALVLWAGTCVVLIGLCIGDVRGACAGPWDGRVPLILTAMGLVGAVAKRTGDALARWSLKRYLRAPQT